MNGHMRISFELPCMSSDEQDVSLAGQHYFLLALGPLMGDDIQYHSSARTVTDKININCFSKHAVFWVNVNTLVLNWLIVKTFKRRHNV